MHGLIVSDNTWVPEWKEFPGWYVNGMVEDAEVSVENVPVVFDPSRSRRFKTKAECQEWCDKHGHNNFKPTEVSIRSERKSL